MLNKVFLVLFGLMLTISLNFAKTNESSNKLIEYFAQEKINLNLAINEIKSLKAPLSPADYLNQSQQNQARLVLIRAKLANFENFLQNQQKVQNDFGLRIKKLQQLPLDKSSRIGTLQRLEQITTLNEVNKKTIELINECVALARTYQELLQDQKHELELWSAKQNLEKKLTGLREQESKINDSMTKLFANSLKLQQDISTATNFKTGYELEARLLLNNQIINLSQYKIAELNLQKRLAKADFLLLQSPDIRTLQQVTEAYKQAISQLSEMEQACKSMLALLKSEALELQNGELKQKFATLIQIINSRIVGLGIQEQTLQEDLENHQQELKNQLSVRQNLSEYSFESWPGIFHEFSQILPQFCGYLKSLVLKVRDNYFWHDTVSSLLVWVMLILTSLVFFALNKVIKRLTQTKERSRFSGHLYERALILFSRNMVHLSGLGLLFVLFYSNQVPYVNYQLLFHLLFVWLAFRTFILIARLALMERVSDSSGQDVALYYRIKRLLLLGGWLTALMVLSRELPLSLLLQDIFNRLFMLFLVVASIFVWRNRKLISHLLYPLFRAKKAYLRNAFILLLTLAPLTLFIIAMIGLVGYINLAWTLSRYQVQILLIITAYILLRGLLFDALELVSEWMIASMKNGWLWIEVILKPLDKILRLLLLLGSLYVLSSLYYGGSDTSLWVNLQQVAAYSLVNVAGMHITGMSIVEFLLLAAVFGWMSTWTREFCFRWLYSNIIDAGIRNSISVFTQYTMILVGGFIALHILGLDFSGMSMILGGLAVGMGFGLRDFANNIVGGLMLLIERPVREGDLITLGGYEGRVAHIGIRSMRVSSWDNMEVLIPNAETFNKPFTNWTHQDSIVRTVVPIKVSRQDDPCLVQKLLFEILAQASEIVAEPEPQVFLKQIDDALLEFELRYFINVDLNTIFEVRSKILFAIMAKFKDLGIRAPIPPFSIEIQKPPSHEKES